MSRTPIHASIPWFHGSRQTEAWRKYFRRWEPQTPVRAPVGTRPTTPRPSLSALPPPAAAAAVARPGVARHLRRTLVIEAITTHTAPSPLLDHITDGALESFSLHHGVLSLSFLTPASAAACAARLADPAVLRALAGPSAALSWAPGPAAPLSPHVLDAVTTLRARRAVSVLARRDAPLPSPRNTPGLPPLERVLDFPPRRRVLLFRSVAAALVAHRLLREEWTERLREVHFFPDWCELGRAERAELAQVRRDVLVKWVRARGEARRKERQLLRRGEAEGRREGKTGVEGEAAGREAEAPVLEDEPRREEEPRQLRREAQVRGVLEPEDAARAEAKALGTGAAPEMKPFGAALEETLARETRARKEGAAQAEGA
ncbi:hypothetical protein FB451DRAFT_1385965 [Mycena latifolia]|nr:hypothetical protein FB451DRAFT_1385965 [Mycena latifolia]